MAEQTNGQAADNGNSHWRIFWVALLLIVLVWLIWRLSTIILPFFLALITAYILNPLVDKLEARGWARRHAVAVVMLALVVLGILLASLILPRLGGEVANLTENYAPLLAKAQDLARHWQERLHQVFPWFSPHGPLAQQVEARAGDAGRWLLQRIPTYLGALFQGILGFMFLAVLTAILSYWTLLEYHSLGRRLLTLMPRRYAASMPALVQKLNSIVSAYLLGLLLLCAMAAIAATIVLALFGVEYSYLLGLLVGVGYAIPYFGYPAATIIIVIVAALTGQGWLQLLAIAGSLTAINLVLDYLITPRVMGERIGLHPMTIIFAVLAMGELFGFIGILISMPVAAAIRVSLAVFFPDLFMPQPVPPQRPAGERGESGEERGD